MNLTIPYGSTNKACNASKDVLIFCLILKREICYGVLIGPADGVNEQMGRKCMDSLPVSHGGYLRIVRHVVPLMAFQFNQTLAASDSSIFTTLWLVSSHNLSTAYIHV